jgi:hypothetical protein
MARVGCCRDEEEIDSVKKSKVTERDDRSRALKILLEAQSYYDARFRRDRERNKRYTYGDQWSDVVCVNGKKMREEQYIMEQGNIPLKNNLIRRLVRKVVGVYRSQSTEPTCMSRDRDEQRYGETMSTLLQYNMQLNCMNEMYARTMEEFLISGFIVHRKHYGWMRGKLDCWTDYVQPNNFFIDTNMRDFRGWDCTCVGEIHDVDFKTLASMFATTPQEHARLAGIYSVANDKNALRQAWKDFGYTNALTSEMDFLSPMDSTRCRMIEVWRKENKPRYRCHDWNSGEIFRCDAEDYQKMVVEENERRLAQGMAVGMAADDIPMIEAQWFVDSYWYYYMLTPQGDILDEGESPYDHGSHPYVFKAYPYIDGEIHSFVSDIIDQQRYTNRLITLYDWIMRASAKGVLLIPEDCLPKGTSPEEFAETWSKFNGVILYKPSAKHGNIPQQIAANSTNIGINELLNLQLKFFEDISGVQGALLGKPGYSGMSAALYSQQTQNSTTSLLDLLDSFGEFVKEAANKDMKNIQQYYTEKQVQDIVGRTATITVEDYDKLRDVDFDLSVVPSTATPAYRAMANEFLMEIWKAGQITLQQMLETGQFPFADELLQSLQSQQAQAQQGEAPDGIAPELQQQVQQGANMKAVNELSRAMRG